MGSNTSGSVASSTSTDNYQQLLSTLEQTYTSKSSTESKHDNIDSTESSAGAAALSEQQKTTLHEVQDDIMLKSPKSAQTQASAKKQISASSKSDQSGKTNNSTASEMTSEAAKLLAVGATSITDSQNSQPAKANTSSAKPASKKDIFLAKHVLPKLHHLYSISTVGSALGAALGLAGKKDVADKIQRAGYLFDTAGHQARSFLGGEGGDGSVNGWFALPTAFAAFGSMAFKNTSEWGMKLRDLGNLNQWGQSPSLIMQGLKNRDSTPAHLVEKLEEIQAKHGNLDESKGIVKDFVRDAKINLDLFKQVLKDPVNILAPALKLGGKPVNVPHAQAVTGFGILTSSALSIITKPISKDLSMFFTKLNQFIPTPFNVSRGKSLQANPNPEIRSAGRKQEIASYIDISSVITNFLGLGTKAQAVKAGSLAVNTESFKQEAKEIFANRSAQILKNSG
jgi:hypothetical protein